MSGRGIGGLDRRRRIRHGQHGLRRMHEEDRQRRAVYNVARGRFPTQAVAALERHRVVVARRAPRYRATRTLTVADGGPL